MRNFTLYLAVVACLVASKLAAQETFEDKAKAISILKENSDVQCIIGRGNIDFGKAQQPGLFDYADGVDTMQFLLTL